MKLNMHYQELEDSYLFSTIAHKVAAFGQAHPEASIIRLGIGDVTRPLCPAVVQAMQAAVAEMGEAASFRGYGPEQGYDFLRQAVQGYYAARGVKLAEDEIFISDGAKSDVGNILDLFDADNTVLVPDPVYPVYVDTNVMAGRPIRYMQANADNGFLPLPDETVQADIIYLCSPNNPTGAVYDRAGLQAWVEYANANGAVILFDAAYEAFVQEPALPRSIFEIEGARTCAIEFCSLSKTAGFTGTPLRGEVAGQGAKNSERRQTEPDVAAPADDQVQRRALYCPARRGRRLFARRADADSRRHRLLSGECAGHCTGARFARRVVHGRQKFPLHLDEVPRRPGFLGVF